MLRNLIIFTERPGASTPKELKRDLNCRRLLSQRVQGLLPIPHGTLCVNWGGTHVPYWDARDGRIQYLNHPNRVYAKARKSTQIRRFADAGVPTLECTRQPDEVRRWLNDGKTVLLRRDIGFGGSGIEIVNTPVGGDGILWDFATTYFPKTHEYRVHVFKDRVIDIAQKKRRVDNGDNGVRLDNGEARTAHQRIVRSHANGWVFAHQNLHLPADTRERISSDAIKAVACLGLDFGAVDVLAKFSRQDHNVFEKLAICEVNTAPGIENTATLNAYVEAIRTYYNAR